MVDELDDGYNQVAIPVSPELKKELTKMRDKLEAKEKRNVGPMSAFLSQQYGKIPSESFLTGYCFIGIILFGCLLANISFDRPPPSKRQIRRCGRRFRRPQKTPCTSGTNRRKKDGTFRRGYKCGSGSRRIRNMMPPRIPQKTRQHLWREHTQLSDFLHGELIRPGAFADNKVRAKYDIVTSKNSFC